MKRFDRVKQYLEDAVNSDTIGIHGNFWKALTLDQFKSYVVQVHGGVQLLIVGNGANSNLVKALEGRFPFGKDTGVPGATFNRMPDPDAGYGPMPAERIAYIKGWIDGGCKDEDESPADAKKR
jgi:hypothetical protein